MLATEREKRICAKFSSYDDKTGLVRCNKCPLRKGIGSYDFRCKANSHYDRKTQEWVYDREDE